MIVRSKGLSTRIVALAFSVIIFLLASIGGTAVVEIYDLRKDVDNIYRHPFAVSNAAKEINIHLNAMHRSMKDVVLSTNQEELNTAISKVSDYEKEAFEDFDIIFQRFLGDKSQIQKLHKNFTAWKSIRDRVIRLVQEGKVKEAAALTKGEGAEHVVLLEKQTRSLVKFAHGKAEEFRNQAVQSERVAFILVSTLLSIAIIVAVIIAVWVVKDLRENRKQTARRENLIDQNILIAWMNNEGKISDTSNHLARLVGAEKSELIGQDASAILGDEGRHDDLDEILRVARSGKVWSGEIRRLDSEGNVHWLLAEVHPELDELFSPVGYSVIYQDVSDKKISVTDKLTGLPNRRSFDATIDHQIRLARRDENYLTLAILDVDYFKKYNDSYGHPKGDIILSRVSKIIKESMRRPGDYVSRIGGEEFAILFSGNDAVQSRKTLEMVCAAVEQQKIPHEKSDVSDYITISIGASVVHGSSIPDVEELYDGADRTLYMAKKKRNSVIVEQGNITTISSARS
ncbi:MAG: diguanylate cyclase [Rhodospirillales bacterium]|nr:diguanylate cyclase [Rhodospirillales bacterium]